MPNWHLVTLVFLKTFLLLSEPDSCSYMLDNACISLSMCYPPLERLSGQAVDKSCFVMLLLVILPLCCWCLHYKCTMRKNVMTVSNSKAYCHYHYQNTRVAKPGAQGCQNLIWTLLECEMKLCTLSLQLMTYHLYLFI